MRDQLIAHVRASVRPAVDAFVDKMAELVAARADQALEDATRSMLERLHAAMTPVAVATTAPKRVRKQKREVVAKRVAAKRSKVARKGQTSDIPARVEAAESKSAVEAPVSEADYSRRGAPRASGKGGFVQRDPKPTKPAGVHGCGKCGQVGHNARSCGRAPKGPGGKPAAVVAAAKSKVDRTPIVVAIPPPPVRPLKPTAAAIEQHRNRLAVLRERSVQQPTDNPVARIGEDEIEGDEEPLDAAIERAERSKKRGTLPKPRSPFVVTTKFRGDLSEVEELDFGGDRG